MSSERVLWDNVIPDQIVIPARLPKKEEPVRPDLVLQRVPGVDYALYVVEYKRERLFPNEGNGSNGKGHAHKP